MTANRRSELYARARLQLQDRETVIIGAHVCRDLNRKLRDCEQTIDRLSGEQFDMRETIARMTREAEVMAAKNRVLTHRMVALIEANVDAEVKKGLVAPC